MLFILYNILSHFHFHFFSFLLYFSGAGIKNDNITNGIFPMCLWMFSESDNPICNNHVSFFKERSGYLFSFFIIHHFLFQIINEKFSIQLFWIPSTIPFWYCKWLFISISDKYFIFLCLLSLLKTLTVNKFNKLLT